jgi:hypothetical protein
MSKRHERRAEEQAREALAGMAGCAKCPFRDLGKRTPDEMRAILQRNYDTNYMECRTTFPKWKPGLCHKGDRQCAGYPLTTS